MTNSSQPSLPLGLGPPDKALIGPGAGRTHSGTVLEEILRASLHLLPGITNGKAATCPDAHATNAARFPIEMKSLKRGSKLVVYKWRMEKELPCTLYFIGIHKRKGKAATLLQIWEQFSANLSDCLILTADEINRLALAEPLNKIGENKTSSGKRNGYQRKGYKEGYFNIPFAKLIQGLLELPFRVGCTLHNLPFSFKVHISPESINLLYYYQNLTK